MIHTPSLRAFLTDAAKLAVTLVGSAVLADLTAENTALRKRNRALEFELIRLDRIAGQLAADLAAVEPKSPPCDDPLTADVVEALAVDFACCYDVGDVLWVMGGDA